MNATAQIESKAAATDIVPMADRKQVEDMDHLCNFYTNLTIEALRKLGYEVKVNHYRYPAERLPAIYEMGVTHFEPYLKPTHELRAAYELGLDQGREPNFNYMSSHGGRTTIEILEPGEKDVNMAYKAEALCSVRDSYNKKKGVLICLGRIFHQLCHDYQFTKAEVVEAVENFKYLSAPHA